MGGVGTGGNNNKRNYSRQQSRDMHQRIQRTKAENAAALAEQERRRRTCPVEIAQCILRRAGYTNVYPHALLKPGSKLFVVGRSMMSKAAMLKLAARLGCRRK